MAALLTRRLAMNLLDLLLPLSALVPTVLMALSALFAIRRRTSLTAQWQVFRTLAAVAWVASLCTLALAGLLHGLDTDRMAGLFSIAGLVELPGLALTPWAARAISRRPSNNQAGAAACLDEPLVRAGRRSALTG